MLYTPDIHYCITKHNSNNITRFSDDTTVVSTNNKETFREKVKLLTERYTDNSLYLNINKTKGMLVDFKERKQCEHTSEYGGDHGGKCELL